MIAGCASTDWSAVTSATANTALAGVLAGFMINGIILLLSTTPSSGQRAGYVQGAGLLFTALVTLGLDSYLFGLVTGDTAVQACRRAWTEAMFAAGMLGLGSVAVIVAVVFLLGVFFWDAAGPPKAPPDDKALDDWVPAAPKARPGKNAMEESKDMLARLCVYLRPGVAVVVIFLLWVTARSYLSSVFDDRPPGWATSALTGILIVDYVVIAMFVGVYAWVNTSEEGWPPVRGGPEKLPASQKYDFVPKFRILNGLINLVWQALQPDEIGETTTLKIALFTVSGYSLLSALFTGFVIYVPAALWNSSSAWVNFMFVGTAVWVLVVALIPLGALLAPTFGPKKARPSEG